jgi:hypothetical protein
MTRRAKWWRVAGALFILVNVGGAVIAARDGEPIHSATHVALALGAGFLWLQRSRRRTQPALSDPTDARLERIEQAVDAVAIEVERVGEAQRFQDKQRAQRAGRAVPPESP